VWVPAGVGPGWDPYGAGYWAYYPTLGYTWISSYPWGWLPYHCGSWNYYSFGWGWSPGPRPGRTWAPVTVVRVHPPGWSMPLRPPSGARPQPGRLVVVDRGPDAKGPWAFNHGTVPRPDHQQALNFNGRTITPVGRADVRPQAFSAARGTAPGSRAVLSGTFPGSAQRPGPGSTYMSGYNSSRSVGTQNSRPPVGPPLTPPQGAIQRPPQQGMNPRPNVAYPPAQSYNQRSNYEARPTPTTHYSAPPPPHYSAPPQQQHYSAPPQQQHYSAPPQAQHMPSSGPRR
jgi:hypothetical protein